MSKILETDRLFLRKWHDKDKKPYFDINQDPKVIEFLSGSLTLEKVSDFIKDANLQQEKFGYTLWAVEEKETGDLAGFVGLNVVPFDAPFTPAVEVGWRLGSSFWGKGYATEAARSALEYGKNKGLSSVVSFTVPENKRSLRVMEKIGMERVLGGDFFHPRLPLDHRFSLHVLYKKEL